MKKLLFLFLTSMLCTVTLWGEDKTVTSTVWSEDFENLNGSIDNADVTYSYSKTKPGTGATLNSSACWRMMAPSNSYSSINPKYDESEIDDNWTFSFYYELRGNRLPDQFAITSKNATLGGSIADNTYLSIDKTGGDTNNEFTVKLGNQTLTSELTEVSLTKGYTITLTCTDAGTDHSTLTLLIKNYDNGTTKYQGTATVDTKTLGALSGVYAYLSSSATAMVYIDDMLLTKDEIVDDTPCSAPTYKTTGANGTARRFTLDCETEGATIYYSETYQEPGEEGWIEYTGEVETSNPYIYAYAYSDKNKTNSEIKTFGTKAGSPFKLSAPQANKVVYDENKGYGVVIIPNYKSMEFVPSDYNLQYAINGGAKQSYTEGDTIFVAEGSYMHAYAMSSEAITSSIIVQTAVRPKAPELWTQDFQSLVKTADSDRHAIVLSSSTAFDAESKSFYNIKQYKNGSQSVDIDVDKRIALTTDSCYFLVAKNNDNGGLLGYKHVLKSENENEEEDDSGLILIIPDEDEEEEAGIEATDGVGINGLSSGQYVFVTTNGGSTAPIAGANLMADASTDSEQIYVATGSTMYIDIPFEVSIKSIEVRSNFEPVSTNEYGYATYICKNPIDILETQTNYPDDELEAYVVTEEVRSGTFTKTPVDELVANTAFILKGKPNTTYQLELGTATVPRWDENLLKYYDEDFNTSSWENPVYVVASNGTIVKAAKDSVITAGTPCIKSNLEEAEYFELTIGEAGCTSLVTPKALDFYAEENIQAYIADYETLEKGVHLAEIASVPAGTPVVVKGNAGTYYVPVGLCTEISGNKLKGSLTESYNTSDTLSQIFTLSAESGKMDAIVDKTTTQTIPAGTVYYISKYIGMEQITTDAYGTATLTSRNNIHFDEVALMAYIVTGETEIKPTMQNVSEIPANTAFIVKGGKPDTTYNVPIHNTSNMGGTNMLRSKQTDYNVDDEPNYIWAWSGEKNDFYRTEEGTVIPAGEAFFVSSYERKPNLGYEIIETNDLGITTHVSRKPLDFSTCEFTAYVATEERTNGNIVLTAVTEVPKGTPFVIKGGQPNYKYEVPVGTCEKLNTNNIFQGDTVKSFFVGDTINIVYIISKDDGEFHPALRTTTIPAGKAYVISKYVGLETIQTDEYGWASHVSASALDLTEQTDLEAYIAIDQKYGEFTLKQLTEIAPKTTFIFHGEPNTTYRIPTGTCTSNGSQNLFQVRTTQTPVSNFDTFIYGLDSESGQLVQRDESYVIPAGEVFIVSNFRGFEKITTNGIGVATHVCENPLDFSEMEDFVAYKATHITVKGVTTLIPMSEASRGTPFAVKGKPSTEYYVPISTTPDGANPDNIFRGSLTDDFYTGSVDTYVYILNGKTGNFARTTANSTIKAKKAYIVSPYRGYVEVTTNSVGVMSYVTDQPLDFSEFDNLVAYIVTGESDEVDANGNPTIYTKPVKEVPTETPIILKGVPDTIYAIPIGVCEPEEWSEYGNNKLLGSNSEDFNVINAYPKKVYGISKSTGNFACISTSATLTAGKAYYISEKMYDTSSAKEANGEFIGEEYTAIRKTESDKNTHREHRFVNLAGQEVDDTYKGIVIDENGRKYNRK